jgi:hypothetical protein
VSNTDKLPFVQADADVGLAPIMVIPTSGAGTRERAFVQLKN